MKKKSKKEEFAISANVLSEIKRKMDNVKQLWNLFTKNKIWIFSALFTASIIHSIIYYGMYGINILEFATISDVFVNFANVFIPLVVLFPFCIFLYLFPNGNSKIESIILFIIKVILLIIASVSLSSLFNSVFGGGLWFLYFLGVLWLFYYENKKALAWICILMFFTVSFIAPLERHNTPLIDRISFFYSEKEYNLAELDKFYFIGGSSDYFYIFDKSEDKVEIIPKSDCQHITRPVIHWSDLWTGDEIKDSRLYFRVKRKQKNILMSKSMALYSS